MTLDNEENWCTCENESHDNHTCPFQSEIYDNSEFVCKCCSYCEHQCSMDV
jgi:hypothetical protein